MARRTKDNHPKIQATKNKEDSIPIPCSDFTIILTFIFTMTTAISSRLISSPAPGQAFFHPFALSVYTSSVRPSVRVSVHACGLAPKPASRGSVCRFVPFDRREGLKGLKGLKGCPKPLNKTTEGNRAGHRAAIGEGPGSQRR